MHRSLSVVIFGFSIENPSLPLCLARHHRVDVIAFFVRRPLNRSLGKPLKAALSSKNCQKGSIIVRKPPGSRRILKNRLSGPQTREKPTKTPVEKPKSEKEKKKEMGTPKVRSKNGQKKKKENKEQTDGKRLKENMRSLLQAKEMQNEYLQWIRTVVGIMNAFRHCLQSLSFLLSLENK